MTHIAAFALGVLATLGMLWAFVYLFSTREETASAPRDKYGVIPQPPEATSPLDS